SGNRCCNDLKFSIRDRNTLLAASGSSEHRLRACLREAGLCHKRFREKREMVPEKGLGPKRGGLVLEIRHSAAYLTIHQCTPTRFRCESRLLHSMSTRPRWISV